MDVNEVAAQYVAELNALGARFDLVDVVVHDAPFLVPVHHNGVTAPWTWQPGTFARVRGHDNGGLYVESELYRLPAAA
mgnify:CR=1 FL=1